VAKSLHALVPSEMRQRKGHFEPENLPRRPLHEPLDHAHHVAGLNERHLDVELRELGLPVGPEVFIAEALRDLHVAIEPGDHQQLLVELWRLGQGEEGSMIQPARHKVVAGALRRAATEHRRLDVDEAKFVEVVPHDLDDPAPQKHVFLHRRPAEIEPPVLEPYFLARQFGRVGMKNGGLGLVEHAKTLDGDFDSARGELGVGGALRPHTNRARHGDHPFGPHGAGRRSDVSRAAGSRHHLRAAPAIAEIDEDHSLVVTDAVHPAAQRDGVGKMVRTQFTAGMGSEHGGKPLLSHRRLGKPSARVRAEREFQLRIGLLALRQFAEHEAGLDVSVVLVLGA
jgi:hypothetical protein